MTKGNGVPAGEYEMHLQNQVRFVTRNVTPEQKAAVIVALDKLVGEESEIEISDGKSPQTLWDKTRRPLRHAWVTRNFSEDFSQ